VSVPWGARLDIVNNEEDDVQPAAQAQETLGIRVATSTSTTNQLVGIGGTIESIDWISNDNDRREYDRMIGGSTRIDAYTVALASMEAALGILVDDVYAEALSLREQRQTIHVFTNNRIVLVTLRAPGRKSRQASVRLVALWAGAHLNLVLCGALLLRYDLAGYDSPLGYVAVLAVLSHLIFFTADKPNSRLYTTLTTMPDVSSSKRSQTILSRYTRPLRLVLTGPRTVLCTFGLTLILL